MREDSFIIASIALIFVAAGLVKGVVGMGLPTVAMGALSLVMAPVAAAAMLVVPSFVPMSGSSSQGHRSDRWFVVSA